MTEQIIESLFKFVFGLIAGYFVGWIFMRIRSKRRLKKALKEADNRNQILYNTITHGWVTNNEAREIMGLPLSEDRLKKIEETVNHHDEVLKDTGWIKDEVCDACAHSLADHTPWCEAEGCTCLRIE